MEGVPVSSTVQNNGIDSLSQPAADSSLKEGASKPVFSAYGGEHIQQGSDFNGKEETKMENEKKVYETPEVTKVEFDVSDRITASACLAPPAAVGQVNVCMDS